MAQVIINGQAVIHGIPNSGSAITISGFATFQLDKAELEHMVKSYETVDSQGNDASLTFFNEHAECTIDFTPSASSQAGAAAIPVFPAPGSAVTIANCKAAAEFASSSIAILNSAYWIYMGGARLSQTATGAAKYTGLKLRIYANAAQAQSLATQAT